MFKWKQSRATLSSSYFQGAPLKLIRSRVIASAEPSHLYSLHISGSTTSTFCADNLAHSANSLGVEWLRLGCSPVVSQLELSSVSKVN